MSEKNLDEHGRQRNKTVAFRMSQEEADLLDRLLRHQRDDEAGLHHQQAIGY